MKISILLLMSSLSTFSASVFGLYCYECSDMKDNQYSGFQTCGNGFGKQVGCAGICAKIEFIANGKTTRFCWPKPKDRQAVGCTKNPLGVST